MLGVVISILRFDLCFFLILSLFFSLLPSVFLCVLGRHSYFANKNTNTKITANPPAIPSA